MIIIILLLLVYYICLFVCIEILKKQLSASQIKNKCKNLYIYKK